MTARKIEKELYTLNMHVKTPDVVAEVLTMLQLWHEYFLPKQISCSKNSQATKNLSQY